MHGGPCRCRHSRLRGGAPPTACQPCTGQHSKRFHYSYCTLAVFVHRGMCPQEQQMRDEHRAAWGCSSGQRLAETGVGGTHHTAGRVHTGQELRS